MTGQDRMRCGGRAHAATGRLSKVLRRRRSANHESVSIRRYRTKRTNYTYSGPLTFKQRRDHYSTRVDARVASTLVRYNSRGAWFSVISTNGRTQGRVAGGEDS